MTNAPRMTLSGVVLDSPDPPALASFYQHLLGWRRAEDEPDWIVLRPAHGDTGLSFQLEENYVRPVWPAGPDDQRMMVHLDIEVEDLDESGAFAQAAGAVLAGFQPQEDVRVYLDPDGHPFCLFID